MIQTLHQSEFEEIHRSLGDIVNGFAGKHVLLAGGCGFLGRHMVEVFSYLNTSALKTPMKVTILDNLIVPTAVEFLSDPGSNIQFIRHDLRNTYEPKEKFDYIVNMAGIASPYYYRSYPMETLEVTIFGTRNLLAIAKEQDARFTFFSSSEIYGNPPPSYVPTEESYRGHVSCRGPRACYDESKRLGETLCYLYSDNGWAFTNTIRPFNVFGPGMHQNDYRVLPNFATKIFTQKPVYVYGSGNQTRTFCYIADAISGFLRVILLGQNGEVYNIGCDTPEISMLGLILRLEHVLHRQIAYEPVPYPPDYPPDEPVRRCPDISKARRDLHFEPIVSLDDGLHRFFEWARVNYDFGSNLSRAR